MASFYDDASLVVIPSGYKTSKIYAEKPTDGSGDLTFTRASDATRVASNGLIEKVRTNLILQSNTFSTTWANSDSTETSGQAGYDGTNNAWRLTTTLSGGYIFQSVAIGGLTTFSIYAKAGTQNGIILYSAHVAQGINFNLSTGVVGAAFVAAPLGSRIESIGNGWYRCSITVSSSSTNTFRIYVSDGSNPSLGNVLIQNSQVEAGDIATDYIPTTTAAVSVGPVSNVPRLDYTNSSCPRLLLEPQRTNAIIFSEQFNNANWTKSGNGVGSAPVITANAAISPDGYQNADKIDLALNGGTSSSDWSWVFQTYTVTANQPQAVSIYLKAATAGDVGKKIRVGIISYIEHTLTTNWTRVELIQTVGSTGAYSVGFRLRGSEVTANSVSFFAYGAQLEQNAPYVSSYIPTLSASVTRVADQALLNNSAALPTAYPFTLFAQINYDRAAESQYPLCLIDSSTADTYINIGLGFVGSFEPSATIRTSSTSITVPGNTTIPAGNNKLAIVVTSANIKIYANGALLNTGTNTLAFNSGMNDLLIGQLRSTADTGTRQKLTQQVIVFKSALTDAQAIELTTL